MSSNFKKVFALCLAFILFFTVFPSVQPQAAKSYGKNSSAEKKSDVSGVRKGDTIYFGSYEQNNKDDGTEPIEWKIIDRDDDYVLALSVYTLDYQRYHGIQETITWADSDIREWLNEDFYEDAFSADEQEKIVAVTNDNSSYKTGEDTDDLVFLLSIDQVKILGSANAMRAKPTAYAAAHGAAHNHDGYGWYWLRTVTGKTTAAFVAGGKNSGFSRDGYVITYGGGIRPAIWIDISNTTNKGEDLGSADDASNTTDKTKDRGSAIDNSITTGKRNALGSAKDYLDFTAFSYTGLIEQLEYEGYTHEEAVYAVDNCGADWNEQAEKMAKDYLEFSSFSRARLINQLMYEGFTQEQAEYGVSQNGY